MPGRSSTGCWLFARCRREGALRLVADFLQGGPKGFPFQRRSVANHTNMKIVKSELEFVTPVTAGGSIKFLPAV